jgi:DNA-binding transcriptional LysR family regulator
MISASPRRLTVFKHVVETGGFNAAAAELGIAQPSVCAHVKALESQLEALYGFALDMLRKSEEATDALADIRSSAARAITIAVHRDVAQSFLPAPLGAFTRKHPGLRIVTRIGTIEDVLGLLRDEVADLGLLVSSGPPSGVTSDVLRREPLWLVATPGHPLAGRKAIAPAELAQFPFVTGLSHSRYQQMVDGALRRMGIPAWRVAMELQESAALKAMVGQGAGIACLLRCAVEKEIEAGTLALLDVRAQVQELELRCAYRAPLRPPLASFLDHLRSRA